MATCKDCLHYEACGSILKKSFPNITKEEMDSVSNKGSCPLFKSTADVVEVVRCKDCKHYFDGCCYITARSPLFKYDVNIHHRKGNDFCSYGERKE